MNRRQPGGSPPGTEMPTQSQLGGIDQLMTTRRSSTTSPPMILPPPKDMLTLNSLEMGLLLLHTSNWRRSRLLHHKLFMRFLTLSLTMIACQTLLPSIRVAWLAATKRPRKTKSSKLFNSMDSLTMTLKLFAARRQTTTLSSTMLMSTSRLDSALMALIRFQKTISHTALSTCGVRTTCLQTLHHGELQSTCSMSLR